MARAPNRKYEARRVALIDAVEAVRHGSTMADAGKKFGVGTGEISSACCYAGVKARGAVRRRPSEKMTNAAIEVIEQRMTLSDAAKKFGVSTDGLANRIGRMVGEGWRAETEAPTNANGRAPYAAQFAERLTA